MAKPASTARGVRWAVYVSVLAVLGVLSPFATGLGLVLRERAARSVDSRDSWRGIWAFAVLGVLAYGLLFWWLHPLLFLLVAVWRALRFGHLAEGVQPLLLLWGYHALLAPVLALFLEVLIKTTQDAELAPRAVLSRPGKVGQRRPGQGAQIVAGSSSPAFPDAVDGEAVIGRALSGNLWQWVRGGYFVYPRQALSQHAVTVAQSGMGKSELLRRIAYTMARREGMKVLWIDGKGDWKDAIRFEMTMRRAGCTRVGIFPTQAHAGWRGTRQDVLNLLMATQIFEQEYFRGVTYTILKLALYAPNLPVVESGAELLRRIYPPTLMALYQYTREHLYLAALAPDALWGPYSKYQAFFSGVQDRLDGTLGFGDWDAAYYLLDEKRLQEAQLAPFARYLIDDFYLYLALRQLEGKDRPILLVLDDFSSYSSLVKVHKLYERVRSSNGSIILSAQGYEGLGEDAERLLEDAATTILGKCNLPEKLIRVTGKKKTPSFSYHQPAEEEEQERRSEQEERPHTVMREEERWLVEADSVRGLGVGEAYVLHGPAAHLIAVERVILDEDAVERRAAKLLREYEVAQAKYEADQARTTGANPAPPGSTGGKKKRKKQKPAPPQPPQPEDVPGGSQASTPPPPSASGGQSAPGSSGASRDQKSGTQEAGPSEAASPPPKPPSLDDIE
jgi:hypothetical protein